VPRPIRSSIVGKQELDPAGLSPLSLRVIQELSGRNLRRVGKRLATYPANLCPLLFGASLRSSAAILVRRFANRSRTGKESLVSGRVRRNISKTCWEVRRDSRSPGRLAPTVAAGDFGCRHLGRPAYLLLGFPANRTDVDRRRNQIDTEHKLWILAEADDPVYAKMGYDRRTHLLLVWRSIWKSVAGQHAARNLRGSSGGGIWNFDPSLADEAPQLSATFTEISHRRGGKVFVATRIHIHQELTRTVIQRYRTST